MKIRKIEKKDDLQVASIIRECLTEYGGDHRPDTAWADPYLEHFSEVYTLPNNAYWVCENDNGTVIAGVGIGPIDGENDVCELQKMYCLKDYRGSGCAAELLSIALDFAKLHYKSCYLETLENMLRAQNFYEKHGFQLTERTIGSTGHTGCPVHYIIDL